MPLNISLRHRRAEQQTSAQSSDNLVSPTFAKPKLLVVKLAPQRSSPSVG
jgi:hypothetical protein